MITVETEGKLDQSGAHFWIKVQLTIETDGVRLTDEGFPDKASQEIDVWLSWCGRTVLSLRPERDLPLCEMCHRQFNAAVKRAKTRAEQEKEKKVNAELAQALEAINA